MFKKILFFILLLSANCFALNIANNYVSISTSTGNVGIGTTALSLSKLVIYGADNNYLTGPHQYFYTSADNYPLMTFANYQHDNQAITFDCYWNGSNWTSCDPTSNFQIYKQADKFAIKYAGGVAAGSTVTLNDGIVISSSGLVGIGTNAPIAKFQVNGTAGNATGTWGTYSDRRLKKDINNLDSESCLDVVSKLQGVSFYWKDKDEDKKYGLMRGFIAQDVRKVMPDWVKPGNNGYLIIDKVGVEAILVEAIKELKERNDKLERRIVFLEKQKRK